MLRIKSTGGLPRRLLTCHRCKSTMASPISDPLRELDLQAQIDNKIPFARAKIGPFFQAMPVLGNQFTENPTLTGFLRRNMPKEVYAEIAPDMEKFGHRVATDLFNMSMECEANPPRIQHYNAWGERVDNIITSGAWKEMKKVAAEEGLIAIAYERKYGQHSRLYQVAKLMLFSSSSGLYSCPLAMTDGAAKSLEVLGDKSLMEHAYSRLTSRDPAKFWTSGQWMTERKGGSDVAGGTQTLAVPQPDGSYSLHGYKWFTSATDSDMALTLGRVVDTEGEFTDGTRGLSMFYLELRDADGKLNNIEVQRLKDKLGTRQLPTAELLLDGSRAFRVSPEGKGVSSIATMLTLTRIHNSLASAGGMRRAVNLARDYTTKRECFGKVIKDHAIHIRNLANMEVETRGAELLTLEMARVLGMEDCGMASEHQLDVFRLMTPVTKLYTAKQAVAIASEGLECFGGAGYLEDTGLPVLLRDAQVLPIWEGTTNILSLDVLRAMAKSQGRVLKAFQQDVRERAAPAMLLGELKDSAVKVTQAADAILDFAANNVDKLEVAGRDFAFSLARTYMGMLLLEHAAWSEATPQDKLAAQRWCQQDLTPFTKNNAAGNYTTTAGAAEYALVFDGYRPTKGSKL